MDIIDFYNAVSSGNLEKVKEYCQKGVDANKLLNRNFRYINGIIFPLPLIAAIDKKQWKVAKYLIGLGANPDVICKKMKTTPRELIPENFEFQKHTTK